MMGAPVYEASEQVIFNCSYEYLHKPRRFGKKMGEFKNTGFPCGEFSYAAIKKAYGNTADCKAVSRMNVYAENALFAPSMCNLKSDDDKTVHGFDYFSESNLRRAPALPPYIISGLEKQGIYSAYTHIAKGAVAIDYYLGGDAADYFEEKTDDFFTDCAERFKGDDMDDKILVWLQGETDRVLGYQNYLEKLELLWQKCQRLGFNKFLIVRVGFWGDDSITEIMRAQEDFCQKTANAYIITRVCSFMKVPQYRGAIYKYGIGEEFDCCRDSFYGFANDHINEKGFKVIAKYAVPNIVRILENKKPVLEEDLVNL